MSGFTLGAEVRTSKEKCIANGNLIVLCSLDGATYLTQVVVCNTNLLDEIEWKDLFARIFVVAVIAASLMISVATVYFKK